MHLWLNKPGNSTGEEVGSETGGRGGSGGVDGMRDVGKMGRIGRMDGMDWVDAMDAMDAMGRGGVELKRCRASGLAVGI